MTRRKKGGTTTGGGRFRPSLSRDGTVVRKSAPGGCRCLHASTKKNRKRLVSNYCRSACLSNTSSPLRQNFAGLHRDQRPTSLAQDDRRKTWRLRLIAVWWRLFSGQGEIPYRRYVHLLDEPASACRCLAGSSRSGERPEPTVTVRMGENRVEGGRPRRLRRPRPCACVLHAGRCGCALTSAAHRRSPSETQEPASGRFVPARPDSGH